MIKIVLNLDLINKFLFLILSLKNIDKKIISWKETYKSKRYAFIATINNKYYILLNQTSLSLQILQSNLIELKIEDFL